MVELGIKWKFFFFKQSLEVEHNQLPRNVPSPKMKRQGKVSITDLKLSFWMFVQIYSA